MDVESKSEILAKLDLMLDLMRHMNARQDRTDNAIESLRAEFTGLRAEFAALRGEFLALHKDVAGLREYVFEFRGEVRGRIDGLSERIGDVNSRLPVPIAYALPGKPAA